MSVVSVVLMLVAEKQEQQGMLRKMGTGYEVPARVLNSVFNGPSFFFGGLIPLTIPDSIDRVLNHDGNRLYGIAGFWFLIGLSIEKRAKGRAIDQFHPIRAGVLFTFAALVCGALAFGGFLSVSCPSPNMTCWEQISRHLGPTLLIVIKYPLRTTYASTVWVMLWLWALCVYFVRRAFSAAMRSTRIQS